MQTRGERQQGVSRAAGSSEATPAAPCACQLSSGGGDCLAGAAMPVELVWHLQVPVLWVGGSRLPAA